MKCNKCHKHWKHVRNLDHVDSVCPECFNLSEIPTDKIIAGRGYDNTVRLEQLFEEILKRHVVLTELREIYRQRLETILKNAQKQAF